MRLIDRSEPCGAAPGSEHDRAENPDKRRLAAGGTSPEPRGAKTKQKEAG
jgi:hypothetical protein